MICTAAANRCHITASQLACRDVTVLVLDRPRHEQIIKEVRAAGARIKLISDGDVGGAIEVAKIGAPVDVLFGIGGTPEGSHSDNSSSDKHVLYPAIGLLRAHDCPSRNLSMCDTCIKSCLSHVAVLPLC